MKYDLPDHLTLAELEEIIEDPDNETLFHVQREARMSREVLRPIVREMYDDPRDHLNGAFY